MLLGFHAEKAEFLLRVVHRSKHELHHVLLGPTMTSTLPMTISSLGGGFRCFLLPLPGKMIKFDKYFSNGLKAPTRYYIYIISQSGFDLHIYILVAPDTWNIFSTNTELLTKVGGRKPLNLDHKFSTVDGSLKSGKLTS